MDRNKISGITRNKDAFATVFQTYGNAKPCSTQTSRITLSSGNAAPKILRRKSPPLLKGTNWNE
ncbi:hypothetical protein H4683_002389 [Filibacter limicola]|uniref:Uncharacterized protein n=1 Tax=Sporosarcina limicola TaxID=34101 RepID=A0A927R6T4_9BACL|nr:hypothetical protein [Sporosarcina limicola]